MPLILYEHALMRVYSGDSLGNSGAQDVASPEILTRDYGDIQTFAPTSNHRISEIWVAADVVNLNPTATLNKTYLVLRQVLAGEEWQDPNLPATKTLNNDIWPFMAISGHALNTGITPTLSTPDAFFTANYKWIRFIFNPTVPVVSGTVYAFNFLVEGLEDLHLLGTSDLPWFYATIIDDDGGAYYGYYKYRSPYSSTPNSNVETPPDDAYVQVHGANWAAQTFWPGLTYPCRMVSIRWSRTGNPGPVTVCLQALDGGGDPDGTDLVSTTVDGNDFESVPPVGAGAMRRVVFDQIINLQLGTGYAIVVRAPNGDVNNRVDWRRDIGEVSGATIVDGGAAYTVLDVLTVVGGTFTTAAQLRVTAVNAGVITGIALVDDGDYTVTPGNPVSVVGGTGGGATFNLSWHKTGARESTNSGLSWSQGNKYDSYYEVFNTPDRWNSYGVGSLAFRVYGFVSGPGGEAGGGYWTRLDGEAPPEGAIVEDGRYWSAGGDAGAIAGIYGRYTMPVTVQRRAFSRLWLIRNRAGPANPPSYEGLWTAGRPSWPLGDVTPIHIPSEEEYGRFTVAGKILGERGSPTLAVTARYRSDVLSVLLRLAELGCDHDLQVHFGECRDPQDFNGGWDKVLVLEAARPTEWSTTEMGAMAPGEDSPVNEEVPFAGDKIYEIVPIVYAEQAEAEAVQRVIDIEVCDRITCGECGIVSDGCNVVFALTLTIGGSPGLAAELLFTQNGGANWYDTLIDTLAANEDPNALACVGLNLVVISEDSESLHWAPIADILSGTEVWTEEGTGFVAGFGPLAIYSSDPRHTWIVGESGYVYFTDDPVLGVVVQDPGVATAQNLNAVHAYDNLSVVAVGDSNALIVTRNGGETWAALGGPVPGIDLTAIWMKGQNEWFVGAADGNLYYTLDGGTTWTQKEFYGDGAGTVTDIKFSSDTVGWFSHYNATPAGRIFRTIDGGYSWYVTPEGNTTLPANDEITALAVCEDVNVIYGGGLADDATDGIIVKGAGG